MSFELTTLGEYATVEGGFAYKAKDFVNKNDVAVLKIKNIRNGFIDYENTSFIDIDKAILTEKWMTNVGDILISMTGSGPNAPDSLVGRVARVWKDEPKSAINQRIGRLCLKEKKRIDLDFLFYILSQKNIQDFLVTNSTGSANQVNISSKTIESVPCPKVTYIESRRISTVLNLFEKKIRILQETSKTLESIAQAIFKSWFVDFDPVHAKQQGIECAGIDKATADLFPNSFVESELGLIPKGWRWGTLDDLADFQNGYAFNAKQWADNGNQVIKISNVKPGVVEYDGCSFVSDEATVGLERFKLDRGDILVGMTGYVGETGLVYKNEKNAYLNQRVGKISSKSKTNSNSYIYCCVRNKKYKQHAESLAQGSAQANISGKDLLSYPLIIPNKECVDLFERNIHPMIDKILTNIETSKTLTITRDTLLPRLISGKLDLSNIEEQIEAIR